MHHPGFVSLETTPEDWGRIDQRAERAQVSAYDALWEENQNLKEEVRRLQIRLEAALNEMEKARRLAR